MSHARHDTSFPKTVLPTQKQLSYARTLALKTHAVLPWEATTSRRSLSLWIDAQKKDYQNSEAAQRPTPKQVAFAERLARIKRSSVPEECFKSRELMSRWLDANNI